MIQTMTHSKVQNTMPDLEPTTDELGEKGSMKGSPQHSADDVPHDRKAKRRRISAFGRGLIQRVVQKRGNGHSRA